MIEQALTPTTETYPTTPLGTKVTLEELADRYLAHIQAGMPPDRSAFVSAHPEMADQLDRRLALVEQLHLAIHGDSEPRPLGSGAYAPRSLTVAAPTSHPETVARYTILSVLGRGASGTVYHAYDPKYDRDVALKLLHADSRLEPQLVERFRREARIVAQLRHPHIVPLHEAGEHDGRPYFDMELVRGETLEDRLSRAPLTPRESAELVRQLADTLDYAHRQGIIHRDVKPSNILVDDLIPQLTDFGLARRTGAETSLTEEGTLIGTVAYMSPEQAQGGAHAADGRSDVYSLGVVLYRLLTGRLPYPLEGPLTAQLYQIVHTEATPLRRLRLSVPRDLETICLKALAKDPADRFTTAASFAEELRRWLHDEPLTIRPPTWREKARRWARRNQVTARVAVAAGVLLVVVGGTLGAMAWEQQAKAILEAETRAEAQFLGILDHARHRLRQPTQGRRTETQEMLRGLSEPWRNLPERMKSKLTLDFRSVYAASLGVPELRIAEGEQIKLTDTAFNVWRVTLRPDGKAMAIGAPTGPLLWERGKPFRRGIDLDKVKEEPRPRLWYSPDGRFLAFAPAAGNLQLWDGACTRAEGNWPDKRVVLAVGFPPDGKRLWACCEDGHVQELSLPELTPLANGQVEGKTQRLTSASFNSDVTRLAVGDDKGRVVLCQSNGQPGDMKASANAGIDIEALAWSPDNSLIAAGTKGGIVHLWRTADGVPSHRWLMNGSGVDSIVFSPDGRLIAAGYRGGPMPIWNVATGEQILSAPGCPWGFSLDGQTLASAGTSRMAFIDLLEPVLVRPFRGHLSTCIKLAWSADSRHFASMDSRNHVCVWHVGGLTPVAEFDGPRSGFWAQQAALAIDERGRFVAYASGGNQEATAAMWDVKARKSLGEWPLKGGYEQLAYREGKFLLVREEDEEGAEIVKPDGPGKRRPTRGVAYEWEIGKAPQFLAVVRPSEASDFRRFLRHGLTPDGRYYWWVGPRSPEHPRRVEVRKVPSGELVARVPLPAGKPGIEAEAVLSTDARYLFINTETDRGWELHELGSGNPPKPVSYVIRRFSPDSRWSVILSLPGGLRPYWTIALRGQGEEQERIYFGNADFSEPNPITFSPDGRYLAWGGTNGTITIADLPGLHAQVREFETTVLPR